MEKRIFFGKEISLLGFGTMRLPTLGPHTAKIDEVKATAMLDYGLAQGINYIDTAHMYHNGESEAFLGKALRNYDRNSYYLATKMPVWEGKNSQEIEAIFTEQLQLLATDYFDFYLCHNLNAPFFEMTKKLKVYEYLARKKEEGVIKHLGFSFHDTPAVLSDIIATYPWEYGQIQLNYIDWQRQEAKEQYEMLTKHNLPCIVMEPVRGGALATLTPASVKLLKDFNPHATPASWALRFAAQLPNVMTVLSGMSSMEQVEDNVRTLNNLVPLSDAETEILTAAKEKFIANKTLPCTGCRYCSNCRQGVDIATMFQIYNNHLLGASDFAFIDDYEATKPSTRESNCTACGNCVEECPQKIDIPQELENMAKALKRTYQNQV